MAVRPLVNIERLVAAHVNSVDGSMTYESGATYKANTTVSYNGSLYTANVDIEDTDTDTPDEAPDRWSLTIGASEVGTAGDISALAARVTALEETVGDDTDGLVKDVDDLQVSNGVLGAKNLVKVTATTQTVNDVTFTINSDGTINVSGTATENTLFNVSDELMGFDNDTVLSGCPSGGSDTTYMMYISETSLYDTGNGIHVPANSFPSNSQVRIAIYPAAGNVNLTFKPMIRLASDTDPTYQPYAMTNRKLTDGKVDKSGIILDSYYTGNIDTINEQYCYMYTIDKSKASGTYPSGSGSVFLLLGFSKINVSDLVVYGIQIALSFTSSTIHIRHFDYTAAGGTWGAWSEIS